MALDEHEHEDAFEAEEDEAVVLLADRITTTKSTAQLLQFPYKLNTSPLLLRRTLAPLHINAPIISFQDLSPSPSSSSDASEESRDGTVTPLTPVSPTEGTSYFQNAQLSPDSAITPRPLRKKTSKLNVKLIRAAFFSGARSPTMQQEGFELRLEKAEKEFQEETNRLQSMLRLVRGRIRSEQAVRVTRAAKVKTQAQPDQE